MNAELRNETSERAIHQIRADFPLQHFIAPVPHVLEDLLRLDFRKEIVVLNRYFIRPTTIDRIHASWITVADRNFLHATRPLYGANIYSSGIARITESGITPVLDTSKKQILEFQAANDGRFYVDTLSWTNTSEIDVYAPDGTFDGTLGPTFGNLDGIALEQTPAVPEPNYMGRECLAVACLGVFALVAHRRVPGAQPTQPAILGIGQQDAVVYSDSKFPAVNSSDC